MGQGLLSRVLRGTTYFVDPETYASGDYALSGLRHGLLFADGAGRVFLEYYRTRREKVYELVWRNPITEILRTVNKRYMATLFETIVRFSRHPDRGALVAGMTFGFDPATGDLRTREVARRAGRKDCTPVMKRLMHEEIVAVGRRLGARRLVAETFEAYGQELIAHGWRLDEGGRSWFIRLAAWLNRDRCYARDLGDEGEGVSAPGEPLV